MPLPVVSRMRPAERPPKAGARDQAPPELSEQKLCLTNESDFVKVRPLVAGLAAGSEIEFCPFRPSFPRTPLARAANLSGHFYCPDCSLTGGVARRHVSDGDKLQIKPLGIMPVPERQLDKQPTRVSALTRYKSRHHHSENIRLNRADSGANAASTEGKHGQMGKPAVLKSMGIHASDVRGRDKALRFPMGKMYRMHGKSIPRLPYTESEMRAPVRRSIAPAHRLPEFSNAARLQQYHYSFSTTQLISIIY